MKNEISHRRDNGKVNQLLKLAAIVFILFVSVSGAAAYDCTDQATEDILTLNEASLSGDLLGLGAEALAALDPSGVTEGLAIGAQILSLGSATAAQVIERRDSKFA